MLIQNLIKDNSWHFDDQKYDMKNAMDFSVKLKKGVNPEIIGPAILVNKSGSPKKINNKNAISAIEEVGISPPVNLRLVFTNYS